MYFRYLLQLKINYLIGGRDRVADDCVELPPGEHLVVDERLLLAVEQNGDGVALVDVPHHARAEVLVAPRQHAVPDPVAQVQVKLVGFRNVEVLRTGPETDRPGHQQGILPSLTSIFAINNKNPKLFRVSHH